MIPFNAKAKAIQELLVGRGHKIAVDGKAWDETFDAVLVELAKSAPPAPPPATVKPGLESPAAFFDALRPSSRFSSISVEQVQSIEADLSIMAERGFPIAWAAYVLATEYHETGGKMLPNVESLNYSVQGLISNFGRHRISVEDARRLGRGPGERALSPARQEMIANAIYGGPWGKANLGNTEPGDGWKYRGRGKDHCTGRANYLKVDKALGLNGALVDNPDLLLDVNRASRAIVLGMESGRYTGVKLADALPRSGPGTMALFAKARPIINGMDRAADVAAIAMFFQSAFDRGGWPS